MNKVSVKTTELFDCRIAYLEPLFEAYEYPWQILPNIREYIKKLVAEGIPGYTLYSEGILIGKNVCISPKAEICAPAVIGSNSEIRVGAYIRGNVITGENCVIGNSCEVKNSILLDNVQVPHFNYVGDSVLGNKTHLGAGAVCSNLKNDGSNVTVRGEEPLQTGLRKLGAILADGVNVGCGCVLNPGTVIGKETSVYPMLSLRGVIPSYKIVKALGSMSERV